MARISKGGVSKKIIHGRTYFYYQWYEDGKKRSRTITQEEAEELSKNKPQSNFYNGDHYALGIELFTGDKLKELVSPIHNYKKRYCYSSLLSFLRDHHPGKILALYGLRRTGKTTMMLQAIEEMDAYSTTAYIIIGKGATLTNLYLLLQNLQQNGVKNIFVDEVTLLEEFIEGASFLADAYGMNMNVVLSGTDSLGFYLSSRNALFDRIYLLHTTYISFKEFSYILDIHDIDRYIEYGGTFIQEGINYHRGVAPAFYDEQNLLSYVDAAIVHNIQHSLENYRDGYNLTRLKSLYDRGGLTSLIQKVIQDNNHRFLKSVLQKRFKSGDYGSLKQLLLNKPNHPELIDFLTSIDEESLYQYLFNALDIVSSNSSMEQEDADEIHDYLKLIGVLYDIKHIDIERGETHLSSVFVQPALRYSQCKALIESLFQQKAFLNLSRVEASFLIDTLCNDVKGRMLEEIVLLDKTLEGKDCFKATFISGEYDMVIYDKESNTSSLYEIKHSMQRNPMQTRFLKDASMLSLISKRFGSIKEKVVLYRGEDVMENDIHYINIEKYLQN